MTTSDNVSLLRNLGAILYDTLLLAAVLLFALIPLAAIDHWFQVRHSVPYKLFASLYLVGIAYVYFAWMWRRGGQTVGMRAWHIRLVGDDQDVPGWNTCALRAGMAVISALCLGLGYLWMLWDRDGRSWHDRASATHLLRVPKPD